MTRTWTRCAPRGFMDILLIFPFSQTHYTVPPLGLGYLATAARRAGFSVDLLDAPRERLTLDGFREALRQRCDPHQPLLIGLQVFSYDMPAVQQCLAEIKTLLPRAITVLGGPHPTGAPRETLLELPQADYAVQGEGERALPRLARRVLRQEAVALETIPGLIYRQDGQVQLNPPQAEEELDALGMPAWDLMDPRGYQLAPQGVFLKSPPVAPLSTSRGCPCLCTYCAGARQTGRGLRLRSVERVLDEVSLLYHQYGVRELHIVDDNFTAVKARALAFCEGLRARNLKIHFTFPNGVRVDTLDRELLLALKAAGCYSMIIGIESGSDRVLKLMQKGLSVAQIRQGVGLIREVGLEVSGFFILGYPGETPQERAQTLAFSRSLGLTGAHFSNFLPLPGTEVTRQLQARGQLPATPWSDLFYSKVAWVPPGESAEALKRTQREAYLRFYLRPEVLWPLRRRVQSRHQALAIARRLKDYLLG